MKSHIIVITEPDDSELALEETRAQLAEMELLKNSVGIVTIHPDYLSSGVYAEVVRALPFPVIGGTTIAQTAKGQMSTFLFSVMVLTSDNCEFSFALSDTLDNEEDEADCMRRCYNEAKTRLNRDAKLALLYVPYMLGRCAAGYIDEISRIDENVPVFGFSASSDMSSIFTDVRVVCGEREYKNRLVVLLISGNIAPIFYMVSITKDAVILADIGEITEVRHNHITKINNVNASNFFESIGFQVGASIVSGLLTCTFILDEKDKEGNIISTKSRSMISLDDTGGIFGSDINKGSILSLAAVTKDVVMETTDELISQIKERHKNKTALLYSCIGRRFALLDEPTKEYEHINKCLVGSGLNYTVAYACGEICPTSSKNIQNSEHNYTLAACVL